MTTASVTPAESTAASAARPVLRLRPSVHASPTPDGIHVRGWATAFTAEGGADLWRVWQQLEPALVCGVAPERLDAMGGRPAAQRAVRRLVEALREHDMTVTVPKGWSATVSGAPPGMVAAWLETVAPDPAQAWQRIRRCAVTVDGMGPVADVAVRALTATGLRATVRPGPAAASDPRVVRLIADGTVAVAAGAGDQRGFVAAPTAGDAAARDATRIADRLGLVAVTNRVPDTLAALVGAAAAHRLGCWAAGLSDPAREAARLAAERTVADHPTLAGEGWPAVLVARAVPPATTYHPWLLGGVAPGDASVGEDTLDDAVRRLDALCDDELGVLPPPQPGDLPQLPVALATCSTGSYVAIGTGASTGAARLDAALRAAARDFDPAGTGRLAVGADSWHADGILLRRLAFDLLGRSAATAALDTGWPADPMARRWWTALTLRFGVAARGTVVRLAEGVFAALIQAANQELSWAVEATPGDAAAFAAFHATAAVQVRRADLRHDGSPPTVCGGAPRPAPPYGGAGGWMTGPWTWPGTRPAEERLQQALRRIVPAARQPRQVPRPHASDLWAGLRAVGFAVREVPDDHSG